MHIFSNLKRFLYDNENFIAIFNNKIYLYNIVRIDILSSDLVIVFFNDKKLEIKGNNLKPIASLKNELILNGLIESVNLYEK